MPLRFLLSGYYGQRNVGDDILLYVTLANLARIDPSAECRFLSAQPVAVPPHARGIRLQPGSRRFLTLRSLLRSDVWLFGGGGVLQDHTARSLDTLRHHLRLARLARLAGRKIALLGVGLGPLETPPGRALVARLLHLADFVTVRDSDSAALAAALGVSHGITTTADLAFTFLRELPPAPPQPPRAARTIGISLLDLAYALGPSASSSSGFAPLSAALRRVLASHPGWRVKLFEFFGSETHGDARVLRDFASGLDRPGDDVEFCPYRSDSSAIFAEIAACDAFIGMRLHSCVLAYMASLPVLMLDYHPKCRGFAREVGFPPGAVVDLDQLRDTGVLTERIEALVESGGRFRAAVPPDVMAARAAENFRLLHAWLGSR